MKYKVPKPGQRIWVTRRDDEWQKLVVTETLKVQGKTVIHYRGTAKRGENIVYVQGCCRPKEIGKIKNTKLSSFKYTE